MNTATIHNGDCVPGMVEHLADNSIDLFVSSIPFGALFMYSGKPQDIGNNQDGVDMEAGQFGLHMRFFIEQLHRVLKPGRNACIHIQQLLRYLNQHGYMGRRDFRGAVVEMFSQGGLEWVGEVAIPKNPQAMAQRLSLHSLMFITGKTNSTKLAPAVNDYVLIFQKPGDADPVVKCLRDDEKNPGGWVTANEWIDWARGVWEDGWKGVSEDMQLEGYRECLANLMRSEWQNDGIWGDILETDILDGWKAARGSDEEKHVCPLQLEVIRRCIKLYTNPGETVLDSFMGIGSTAYVALEQGRNAVGFELHDNYHKQAIKNVQKIQGKLEMERSQDLFSAMGIGDNGMASVVNLETIMEDDAEA
jgi:DNA modification methylase